MLRQKSRTIILFFTVLVLLVVFLILVTMAMIAMQPPHPENPALRLTASSVIMTNSAVASHTATAQAR